MPYKTYYKPIRSSPRYFSTCDVGRVAYNCRQDTGAGNNEIMRCVAKALGEEYFAAKKIKQTRAERINRLIELVGSGLDVDAGLAGGFIREGAQVGLVEQIEVGLIRGLLRIPVVSALAISALGLATEVANKVDQLLPAYDMIKVDADDEDSPLNCRCKFTFLIGGKNEHNSTKTKASRPVKKEGR